MMGRGGLRVRRRTDEVRKEGRRGIWQDAAAYAGYDSRYLFAYIHLHILLAWEGRKMDR